MNGERRLAVEDILKITNKVDYIRFQVSKHVSHEYYFMFTRKCFPQKTYIHKIISINRKTTSP